MKLWNLVFALALCLSLAACQSAPAESTESPAQTETPVGAPGSQENPDGESVALQTGGPEIPPTPGSGWDSAPATVLTCRIVDGAENGNLLLAELGEGLYGETGVYRLNLSSGGPRATIMYGDRPAGKSQPTTVPVYLDGEAAEPSALEDGMTVDVTFNGHVQETFPAQLGEVYSVTAWSIGQEKNPAGTSPGPPAV